MSQMFQMQSEAAALNIEYNNDEIVKLLFQNMVANLKLMQS